MESQSIELNSHGAAYQLDKVQRGEQLDDFKPIAAVGRGVEETRIAVASGPKRSHFDEGYRNRQEALRAIVARCEMSKSETYASVWDALADTPSHAAVLRARAELMRQIAAFVGRQDWTQVEAARHCGVTQPRMNDLLRGGSRASRWMRR